MAVVLLRAAVVAGVFEFKIKAATESVHLCNACNQRKEMAWRAQNDCPSNRFDHMLWNSVLQFAIKLSMHRREHPQLGYTAENFKHSCL